MISDKLRKALHAQVGNELAASHQYLAVAVYFANLSLDGWADFFYAQSDEEREHGMKIVKFLVEVDAEFTLPALAEAKPKFKSPLAVLEGCLKQEQAVTQSFKDMAAGALKDGDYVGFQFLQWFIEEQVEEESLFRGLIDLVKSDINLFQAQALLKRE